MYGWRTFNVTWETNAKGEWGMVKWTLHIQKKKKKKKRGIYNKSLKKIQMVIIALCVIRSSPGCELNTNMWFCSTSLRMFCDLRKDINQITLVVLWEVAWECGVLGMLLLPIQSLCNYSESLGHIAGNRSDSFPVGFVIFVRWFC